MKLANSGIHHLFRTVGGTKILSLNGVDYPWITANHIGDILVHSDYAHTAAHDLSFGRFRLYFVDYYYSQAQELDLEVSHGVWKRYYLPHGLPTSQHPRSKITSAYRPVAKPQPSLALA